MLYKVNEYQWVSLRTIEVIRIKQGVNGKWYLELSTGTGSNFTDDFDNKEEARLQVLKIQKLMEDLVI